MRTGGRDIQIELTAVRPGEKLSEELSLLDDEYQQTEHKKMFISRNGFAAAGDTFKAGSDGTTKWLVN